MYENEHEKRLNEIVKAYLVLGVLFIAIALLIELVQYIMLSLSV